MRPIRLNQAAFTLIEMVIGITVLAVSLAISTSVMAPQMEKSVEPVFQVKATELANGLIEEMAGKLFDENSESVTGVVRCGENGVICTLIPSCTGGGQLTSASEERNQSVVNDYSINVRSNFDDIDDYHCMVANGATIFRGTGASLGTSYSGYTLSVQVGYDADMNGVTELRTLSELNSATTTALYSIKLITVTVTTPTDESIVFSTYRFNF